MWAAQLTAVFQLPPRMAQCPAPALGEEKAVGYGVPNPNTVLILTEEGFVGPGIMEGVAGQQAGLSCLP